jgi:hypothetical protein
MHLGLYRREHLHSGDATLVGAAVVEQIQRTHGAINAWQDVEHAADGRHTAVTGDSVTVSGSVTGAGGHVGIGDLPATGTPPSTGGYGLTLDPWRIVADRSGSGALLLQFLSESLGGYLVRLVRTAAYGWTLHALSGIALALGSVTERLSGVWTRTVDALDSVTVGVWRIGTTSAAPGSLAEPALAFQSLVDGSGPPLCLWRLSPNDWILSPTAGQSLRLGGGAYPIQTVDASQLYTQLGVMERGRAVAMGEWQDVPYSPALFSTAGGAAWTVAANAYRYRYALVGRVIQIQFMFAPSSVGTGAGNCLQVQVPPGMTFAAGGANLPLAVVPYCVNAGAGAVPQVYVQVLGATAWGAVLLTNWAPSSGGTVLYGSFTAEIG